MRLSRAQAEGFKVGDVKFSAHPTPDLSSWLLCDGSAISRATYAALYAAIGTTYGVGDGSTTFNIPNGARVLAAYKAADPDFGTVGATGGAKTHALSIAELATHHHNIATHYSGTNIGASATNSQTTLVNYNTDDVGSGTAFGILDPFLCMKLLIKFV
jgi:microcystin-dependent protein